MWPGFARSQPSSSNIIDDAHMPQVEQHHAQYVEVNQSTPSRHGGGIARVSRHTRPLMSSALI